jgi:hypothetical protein
VKKELAVMYKFVFGFAWMVITFWGCTDEINKAGLGILPTGDLVTVRKWVSKNDMIKAYIMTDVKQRTDEPAINLLGTFNDPIFGKTTADFACQFRLNSYPDFTKNAQPDSLVLYLYYTEVYGDTITPQKMNVYELASDLSLDGKYYQDVNLKGLSNSELLGEKSYLPKFRLDSLTNKYGSTKKAPKDTVIQEIAIKLDQKLIQKLMTADTLTLSDNDKFIKYFKGLYVQAGDLNTGGAIMNIFTVAALNSRAQGSYLVLHYHNSEKDSLFYSYGVNSNAARVSRFYHDYSTTKFAANLDKQVAQDSLIYLQTTGGLRNKIVIPNLGAWSDSTNFAINKAELIFQVDSTITDLTKLLPPEQLILAAIGKSVKTQSDSIYYLSDFSFSSQYFGGTYNSKDKTYRFNIAKHLQEIIEKKKGKENLGFYLEPYVKNSIYRRVVLKGATSKTGIRLEITYSKVN